MLQASKEYLKKAVPILDVPLANTTVDKLPESWLKIFYKEYPRFKSLQLQTNSGKTSLDLLLLKRESARKFSKKPISFKAISDIIYWSCAEKPKLKNTSFPRRMYPSGGGRYPIEAYLLAFNIEGLNKGIYHYNVKENRLELLLEEDTSKETNKIMFNQLENPAGVIVLSPTMSRIEVKYGTIALMIALLETGHIGQNICLKATEQGIGSCAITGFERNAMACLLDLDAEEEIPVYCIALGITHKGSKQSFNTSKKK
ncbi:MAG: SagB/ThcOx family dehydrogenase [Candidatus Diapherotrites archaeon]|nr:SagB/ThcOx family dehydrogenase [Candidatus Diapherotrites archaeon]